MLDDSTPESVGVHRGLHRQFVALNPDTTARVGPVVSG